ncbi:alanine--tRNA ligase, cytoplasmic-like [Octopus sinensis]|uniref:alanine--tRNA ligase n=1 Tax=Octopus sinensis TaxID=2607531 RepID=A0A6P7U1N1_9MOLL|nr:alanine--tRNA ligase, cytoplasmic-like [Octopus sinensis]
MNSLSKVVNSQRCCRVGGKHNDLDWVGYDLYHHTFFEMLGSWSFGSYFKVAYSRYLKEEACQMAWELLTSPHYFGLEKDRLYITYFGGDSSLGLSPDFETRDIWRALGLGDGTVTPLPCPGVDNGIGLERITAVLNGLTSNYETDLFRPLIDQIGLVTPNGPYRGLVGLDDVRDVDMAYRVVADHSRMFTYAIADGLMPGNRGNELNLFNVFIE